MGRTPTPINITTPSALVGAPPARRFCLFRDGPQQGIGAGMTHDGRIFFRVDARLVAEAQRRARDESMTLPEYMRSLVRRELKTAA